MPDLLIRAAKRSTSAPWESSNREAFMEPTDLIGVYRRFLKRRNYSKHTVKNYINILGHFIAWLRIPIEQVTNKQTDAYMDHLLRDRKKPKTINCHLGCIPAFYDYLIEDGRMALINPVRKNYRLVCPDHCPNISRTNRLLLSSRKLKTPEIEPCLC